MLFQYPQQVLAGDVYSKLLKPSTVIKEVNNSNKLHLIKRATWNPKYGTWTIEAHELHEGGDYLLQENDDKILQETGDGIYL